jgi:BirA family biotin operon repressor/biotin-[acetyl-CoA-carboxylase] ligase
MSSILPDPNRFDLPRITASSVVGSLEYRQSAASTQDVAIELSSRRDLATPLLVLADEQTAGRGRGQRSWWAARGALTFSCVLDSKRPLGDDQPDPRQSLAAGLAICEIIRPLAPAVDCGLKWPNDVILAGRKVSGVLVDTIAGSGTAYKQTIFGIGVNVNNPLCEAPPELAQTATSLFDTTRRHHDLTDLLLAIVERLHSELSALTQNDPEQIERWQAQSLLDGRRVRIQQGSNQVDGRCLGIDASGALILQTATGRQHVVSGEVHRIDPPLTDEISKSRRR